MGGGGRIPLAKGAGSGLNGKMSEFEYQVVRSPRRKTVSIAVHGDNRIVVTVPEKLSAKEIKRIVEKKSAWIRRVMEQNRARRKSTAERRFASGEKLLYLGREYMLLVEAEPPAGVSMEDGTIRVGLRAGAAGENPSVAARKELIEWYALRALEGIEKRLRILAPRVGVAPEAVTVKAMRTRWGSCSTKGRINLAWNIVMAPEAVLDYLLVHELCHMVHHNHSARYWEFVESILPDYRESRAWLKENGHRLRL